MNIKSKQFGTIVPGTPTAFNSFQDLNAALREWKKYQKSNRISEELHDRKAYSKPSEKRILQREKAIRKNETEQNS